MALENNEPYYVYLDFDEKIFPDAFAKTTFLRVANLNTPTPLIQLNDYLFKGSYTDAIGTNLFFKENADVPVETDAFTKESPILLEPLCAQFKTIQLKSVKIPWKNKENVSAKNDTVEQKLNLNQDYDVIMTKIHRQGYLNLEDLLAVTASENDPNKNVTHKNAAPKVQDIVFPALEIVPTENPIQEKLKSSESDKNSDTDPQQEPMMVEPEIPKTNDKVKIVQVLNYKYEKLKKLARMPVKRSPDAYDI